jgi:uncharacterized protein (DUF1499 family)
MRSSETGPNSLNVQTQKDALKMKVTPLHIVLDEEHEFTALREILLNSSPRTPYANAMREEMLRAVNYDGPPGKRHLFPEPNPPQPA